MASARPGEGAEAGAPEAARLAGAPHERTVRQMSIGHMPCLE